MKSDNQQFTQITNMSVTVSQNVAKFHNVHLTIHPENTNPLNRNVCAVNYADEGQAFFCLVDQINIPENDEKGYHFLLLSCLRGIVQKKNTPLG